MSKDWPEQLAYENWYEKWEESEHYDEVLGQFILNNCEEFLPWLEDKENIVVSDGTELYEEFISTAMPTEWRQEVDKQWEMANAGPEYEAEDEQ